MKLVFCSLSSGSSGNCYYVGNEFHGILIDAGISATSIRKFLNGIGISIETIMGILITHNHIDHVRGLEVLARKHHLPVFTTKNVWQSILTPHSRITHDCIREITLKSEFNIAGFGIEAFPVCHDAPETIGFQIRTEDKKVTIATDLGHICENSQPYIRDANLLVIESNYDEEMLMNGGYPYFLKKRIHSDNGHLANSQTATFLSGMMNENLTYICLAHLSKNNNTPEKALGSLMSSFSTRGISLNGNQKVMVLNRNVPSEVITF